MRRLTLLVIGLALLVFSGCASAPTVSTRTYGMSGGCDCDHKSYQYMCEEFVLNRIITSARQRGYMTLEEVEEFSSMEDNNPCFCFAVCDNKSYGRVAMDKFYRAYVGLMPYEGMFYLALEKEDYSGAEIIRRRWIKEMEYFVKTGYPNKEQRSKLEYQLEKLTSVVGLADPMLIKLRAALAKSMAEEDWDSVQKIQSIITNRVVELRPSQPQVIHKEMPSGQTTVVVQQPSEQRIKVEQVPRYGAEDVGRAISLLEGKSGLTNQQKGALKLFDMLTGR